MSQPWQQQQQQQPGFQYAQPTGYQQPMQTGYPPGGSGFLQPQRTGFPGGPPQGFQQGQGPPPVPPMPQGFGSYQQQPGGLPQQQQLGNGMMAQQQRFLSPSPAPLTAQPTGWNGGIGQGPSMRPLMAQQTGYNDPRLQMMSSTFMPANISAPYAPSGVPQFAGGPNMGGGGGPGAQGGASLQQSFQQHNQAQRGTTAPKVPWALSKDERKNYDQIFRAWDTSNSGFISGEMASEVFGQSGLDRNDLAQIWCVSLFPASHSSVTTRHSSQLRHHAFHRTLADGDNRGKLNIAEFHVAMGLIYRRKQGFPVATIPSLTFSLQ